jgi:hypothetical protein
VTIHRQGSIVSESGIYEVIHDQQHAQKHEVTCIKGKRFPPCRKCGDDVGFKLVRSAVHIEDNQWFQ